MLSGKIFFSVRTDKKNVSQALPHLFQMPLICLFSDMNKKKKVASFILFICQNQNINIFWGELIDKYKDINTNSKSVFTDYAMLKLVLYSPHMFLLFCQSKVGVVKNKSGVKYFI